jgi:hypothetical protein
MSAPRPTRLPPPGKHLPTGGGPPQNVDLLAALSHLTDRDLAIADWLDRHGVLTTAQISQAFFTSPTTASHRLTKLHRLTLVDRFRRPLPGGGFSPWHWMIGPLGARLTAAAHGASPPTARVLRDRHARLAASTQLAHRLGTNQFFIDLDTHARRSGGAARLLRWWSERETADRYLRRIHPDGHALWHADDTTVGLFLEYDTGSQPLDRLVAKLDAYEQLARDGGPAYPVLFWLHAAGRERHLHERLGGFGVVAVATAVRGDMAHPAGAVWSLVGDPLPRRRLADLPSRTGRPGSPYNPDTDIPALTPSDSPTS